MKLLKLTLFTFICSVILMIAFAMTNLALFCAFSLLSGTVSFAALVAWICTKMFKKFRYSLNVILIFIFSILTAITSVCGGATSQLETYEDFINISPMSIAWLISVFSLVISILVLVGRAIFSSKKIDENIDVIDKNTDMIVDEAKKEND